MSEQAEKRIRRIAGNRRGQTMPYRPKNTLRTMDDLIGFDPFRRVEIVAPGFRDVRRTGAYEVQARRPTV